jgi:hypothetical protein
LSIVGDPDGPDVGMVVEDDVFVVLGVTFSWEVGRQARESFKGWSGESKGGRSGKGDKDVEVKFDWWDGTVWTFSRRTGMTQRWWWISIVSHSLSLSWCTSFDLQLANLTADNLIPARGADLLMGAALKAVLATAVRRRATTMVW